LEGQLVYKFPLSGNSTQIWMKANDASWDFFTEPGGSGRGCSMLEASRDGVTWVTLKNSLNPRLWGVDWNYENYLPQELLGGSEIWIRVRMLVESCPNSSYTVAQFGRSTSAATVPVFSIRAKTNLKNMVAVQGGTLPQGSSLAGQSVGSFEIGKFEVTWGEWKEVRAWAVTNGYADLAGVGDTYPSGSPDNFPVVYVSWYDAVKWSNAKSQMEGLTPVYTINGTTYKTGQVAPTLSSSANGYRLPSEKEWEWAARGGVSSQGYAYSGNNDINAVAWYYSNSSSGTKAVGTKTSNELGIYDMSGNVWEWCEDWDAYFSYRRGRGGSWRDDDVGYAAVAFRGGTAPDYRSYNFGFRLARNAQ
jgi:formylglycine-generating enzyme required for sulfatase activity